MSRFVTQGAIRAAIRYGLLDPRGKTDEELLQAFAQVWANRPEDFKLNVAIDHRQDLLKEARRYIRTEQYELACLLMAIWTEHFLNALIHVQASRVGATARQMNDMIRVTLHDKISWLMPLLGLRSLPQQHADRIRKLADLRNAFAHYKWRNVGEDSERYDLEMKRAVVQYEKTVKFLQDYESKRMLHSTSRRLARSGD